MRLHQQLFKSCCRVLPVALGHGRSQIGLAREIMVDARGLDADFVGQFAEVYPPISMRLCSPLGRGQDGLPGI